MTGYVVLRSLTELEDIVACWPLSTLANTALAHYPNATADEAVLSAVLQFGTVCSADIGAATGKPVLLSIADAEQRIKAITARRRSATAHKHRTRSRTR